MLVKLQQFQGKIPKLDPHLLLPQNAVVATNCKLNSGALRPWKEMLAVDTVSVSDPKTIFLHEGQWLAWAMDVNVVKSPIANDTLKRIYLTGDGAPKTATADDLASGTFYSLGIPIPKNAPTVALGPDWTLQTLPASGGYVSAYGNGVFVAVKVGTVSSMVSADGIAWTQHDTVPNAHSWAVLTFGNGMFVLLSGGSDGYCAISTDGITWTAQTVYSTNWISATYGNGLFVAIGDGIGAASSDGATWTTFALPDFITSPSFVRYGNGMFVLVSSGKLDKVGTSSDVVNWQERNLPVTFSDPHIAFGDGVFLLVNSEDNTSATSADGIVWTTRNTLPASSWGIVEFGADTFLAIGYGSTSTAATSTDKGKTWVTRKLASLQQWASVSYGNMIFVATPYDSDTVNLLTNLDQTLVETRSYEIRFKSANGEVGPPGPASTAIDVWPGQTVELSGIDTAPDPAVYTGDYQLAKVEIFRTNSGSTDTYYQYTDEIDIGVTTYTDSKLPAELGAVLNSIYWDMPPDDLSGLIALPNGSLCGFSGNEVCLSVPYQPHAWPLNQRYPVGYPVVATETYGNTILITTQGQPYVMDIGDDLTALRPVRSERGFSNQSKRGTVDMGDVIAYPEPTGLRTVGFNGFNLATVNLFDKEKWQNLSPATISAYYYAGIYFAFSEAGNFLIDLIDGNVVDLEGIAITAGYHDPASGDLFLASGGTVYQWDAGTVGMTYTWESKPFIAQRPIRLSCAQVFADAYPVTMKLFADGNERASIEVQNAKPFRLPNGYRGVEWSVEFSGVNAIYEAFLAESMNELRAAA